MLTIDIGNSCIKWAVWHGGQMTESGGQAYDKRNPEAAFDVWLDLPVPGSVSVACVAGEQIEQALNSWVQKKWSLAPVFLRTTAELNGVINAYAEPAQHGVDRWAALLGVHEICRDPVCIIDAGTAITVDLMDAHGRHLGGRIMPGLAMMRSALSAGTQGIAAAEGQVIAFASNTADAVSSGTLHMLHAALAEVCASAKACLGSEMIIIITGGMAAEILTMKNLPEMRHEPDLVLTGLYAALSQQLRVST